MAKSFPNTGATVIDSSADLPTASATLEGILMFQKDTNELKICDGASWVSVVDTDATPGLVKLIPSSVSGTGVSVDSAGKITLSAATSATINGVFSTTYRNYHVVFSLNSTGTTSQVLTLKFTSAGSVVASNYYTSTRAFDSAVGANTFSDNAVSTSGIILGWLGEPTFNPLHGYLNVSNPAVALHKSFYGMSSGLASSLRYLTAIYGGTFQTNATNIDGFNLSPSANGMTGEVTVYGYRNS